MRKIRLLVKLVVLKTFTSVEYRSVIIVCCEAMILSVTDFCYANKFAIQIKMIEYKKIIEINKKHFCTDNSKDCCNQINYFLTPMQ